ncbi:ParB/Srx family N-terminal domain-containing protein [Flammeovirga sp. SubArs3]|uniref:ParB/RepB/Spo0J family partition protein n=1 Tax=Flammeovirga sp. SubArs3 TaxID=2995316 RepID=UPI00248C564E|nr:ParB/Srx family N-terminal domain-containing protein [Flammeovirga sp. SubArs3]
MLNLDKFKKKEEEKHKQGMTSLREKESSEKLTQVDYKSPGSFHIEPEYRELIRKQTADEAQNFEKSIKEEGVREPILYWTHTLRDDSGKARVVHTVVDGHHRCEAAIKLGLEYVPSKELKFNSHNDVRIWMLRNQLGRRNIGDAEKITIALQLTEFLGVEAKERKKRQVESFNKGQKKQTEAKAKVKEEVKEKSEDELELQAFKDTLNMDPSGRINRAEEAAKIAGVSTKNVTKMKKIIEKGGENIVRSVIDGDLSIHKAWTDIRASEKDEKGKSKVKAKPSKAALTPKVIQSLLQTSGVVKAIGKVGYAFRYQDEAFDAIQLNELSFKQHNDFNIRFVEDGKEVRQSKNIEAVQFVKLNSQDIFPLIIGYQYISTADDLKYISSLNELATFCHKFYVVVNVDLAKEAIAQVKSENMVVGVITIDKEHKVEVVHESHYIMIEEHKELQMMREGIYRQL